MKQWKLQEREEGMKAMKSRPLPIAVLALCMMLAGCGGGKGSDVSQPQPPAGSQGSSSHNYVGTQSVDESGRLQFGRLFGGTWTVTLDPTDKYFSYENVANEAGFSNKVTTGSTSGSSGFLTLDGTSGLNVGAAGYALEVPGEAAMVRPGDGSNPPVVSVVTTGCPSLSAATTYQFISFGTSSVHDANTHVAYGSVQASNTGTTWSFSDLNMYTFAGTALSPTAIPTGNCGYTQLGYVINVPPSADTGSLTLTAAVSPSGYFILDQGQGEPSNAGVTSFPATGPVGLVGVEKPSSAIDTSSLVTGKYLGFELDPIDLSLGRKASLAVSFGQTAGSGTAIYGGTYPNDDVTQTPLSNIEIDFGQQDGQNNGLFKGVTVTVPDTYAACVSTSFGGTDASGNPTCIFKGVAVVGKPNGKFAVFITVNDVSLAISHYSADAALDFFLYQQ